MVRKLAGETFLIATGNLLNKVPMLLINVLLARYSTLEQYGQFSILRSTVNLVETTFSSSLNPVLLHLSARTRSDANVFAKQNSALLLVGLSLSLLASTIFFFFSEQISSAIFVQQNGHLVRIAAVLLFVTNASGVVGVFLISGLLSTYLPLASIASGAAAIFFAFMLLPQSPMLYALTSLVILYGIDFFIKILVCFRFRVFSPFRAGLAIGVTASSISRTVVILILSSATNALAFWYLRIITIATGNGHSHLALFDVSFQYIAVEMMLLNSAVAAIQSRLGKTVMGVGLLQQLGGARTLFMLAALTTTLVLFNFAGSSVMIGIYGASYDPGVLRFITLVLPFYAYALLMNRFFVSVGGSPVVLIVSCVSSFFAVVCGIFFISDAYTLSACFIVYYAVSVLVYVISSFRQTSR